MNIIVAYKSKTGFTKQYAEWIGEALECQTEEAAKISRSQFDAYDMVIYGARVHAGKIDGLKKITAQLRGAKCKLVVFATGATPAESTEIIDNLWSSNLKDIDTPHFYFQAGLCYEKMGFFDKAIMKFFNFMLAKSKNKTEADKAMSEVVGKSYDNSSIDSIMPLVEFVRSEGNK